MNSISRQINLLLAGLLLMSGIPTLVASANDDFAPPREERRLPKQMHSAMKQKPHVTMGQSSADIVGSDNVILRNQVRLNEEAGIFFRNETEAMAGHRNRLEANVIENNGVTKDAPGIRVRGETKDLQFTGNIIRETRKGREPKQTVGVLIEEKAGAITFEKNSIEATTKIDDRRKAKQ